jgi:hypothetical protein
VGRRAESSVWATIRLDGLATCVHWLFEKMCMVGGCHLRQGMCMVHQNPVGCSRLRKQSEVVHRSTRMSTRIREACCLAQLLSVKSEPVLGKFVWRVPEQASTEPAMAPAARYKQARTLEGFSSSPCVASNRQQLAVQKDLSSARHHESKTPKCGTEIPKATEPQDASGTAIDLPNNLSS